MALDITAVLRSPVVILLAAIGLVVLKVTIIVGLARAFRIPARVGLETGLLLGPAASLPSC
jgi:CPA2 family monovalent cation:H+ antiporter-2